jgi:hypothetical protein
VSETAWTDPDWLATAHGWIDERVGALGRHRTGAIEQPHVRSWGTVLRVPTDDGTLWFKATGSALRHEAAVHTILAARSPERVPPLLAADLDRGWLLAADAGRRLREVVAEERSLVRWHDALDGYARVQLASRADVPALLATGMPHHRLDDLAAGYADLVGRLGDDVVEPRLRDAADRVGPMVDRLASYGIEETVQHDDLHDGQVFVAPDGAPGARHRLLDWGDACVSHPFLSLAVTLLGVVAWGVDDEPGSEDVAPYRDTYLAPFAAALGTSVAALADAADLGARLGWARRAVNGHVDADPASTVSRLRMYADGG